MTVFIAFVLITLSGALHVLVLLLLSIRRSQLPPYSESPPSISSPHISASIIRWTGVVTAVLTLSLPYTAVPDNPFMQPAIRVVSFFYACKLLDLSLTRSEQPPTCLQCNEQEPDERLPAPLQKHSDHLNYVFLLLTEMRYPSFDIKIEQKGRPAANQAPLSNTWNWLPPIIVPIMLYFYPATAIKCACVLAIIQFSFEALHILFHHSRPSCTQSLFYMPFAAGSISSFWATHWHAGAAPFLQSLAYRPGKRFAGQWFAVLATFNLTGLWHAWASAPLVEPEYANWLGFKVWLWFMMMGFGILLERVIWGKKQNRFVQWAVVWAFASITAGFCFQTVECFSRIEWLRSGRCNT